MKINLRLPVFLFSIFCIYIQTMCHPGGPDYLIYERFYINLVNKDWNDIFSFLSSELLLLPFFLLGFLFDVGYRWAVFLCFLFLYVLIYLRLLLSKNNLSYFFSLAIATLLVSPMAPYLFGNVIRQGLATFVVIYFMVCHLSGNAGNGLRFIPAFLLTHRASIILSFFQFYLSSKWLIKCVAILSFGLLTYIVIHYFGENIISLIEFYKTFDYSGERGQTSLQRTIFRFFLIVSPLIIWIILEKNSLQRDWRIVIYFIASIFIFLAISIKIGDRVMYFTPAIIYPIIFASSSRLVIAISVLFIVLPTIILTIMGNYENIFS